MEQKNLALQQQEWKPSKTGSFADAMKGIKIKSVPVESLQAALRLIMTKVGVRAANFPDGLEKDVLINHIMQNFGSHTIEEVILAFDKAIAGELECEVNHYENFSCMYFSQIMNAYRAWARERYKELPKEKPKELSAPPEPVTDEEWIEIGKGLWKSTKNIMLIPTKLYRLLNLNPTDDEKERIKQAADRFISNLIYHDKDYFIGEVDKLSTYNRLLRQIAVAEFFNNNLKQDEPLRAV
jgi:hypothetical protein